MSSVAVIELDTTPPVVTLGQPSRRQDGKVEVPYTIDEPSLVAAQVGPAVALVETDRLVSSVVLDQGGQLAVSWLARDSVGNEITASSSVSLGGIVGGIRRGEPGNAVRGVPGALARPQTGRADRGQPPHINPPSKGDLS